MIKIKSITVKNFMSVGNTTQAVDFNKQQLTLVLGENLDQGGDDSGKDCEMEELGNRIPSRSEA